MKSAPGPSSDVRLDPRDVRLRGLSGYGREAADIAGSTPQVNAPCDPPPCKARSTKIGWRRITAVSPTAEFICGNSDPDIDYVVVIEARRRTSKGVLVDLAVLHDDLEVLGGVGDQVDVLQRIAVDQQQVGECALLHDAELAGIRIAFA